MATEKCLAVQAPTNELTIDRQRYNAMSNALGKNHWRWFTVTASDQVQTFTVSTHFQLLLHTIGKTLM